MPGTGPAQPWEPRRGSLGGFPASPGATGTPAGPQPGCRPPAGLSPGPGPAGSGIGGRKSRLWSWRPGRAAGERGCSGERVRPVPNQSGTGSSGAAGPGWDLGSPKSRSSRVGRGWGGTSGQKSLFWDTRGSLGGPRAGLSAGSGQHPPSVPCVPDKTGGCPCDPPRLKSSLFMAPPRAPPKLLGSPQCPARSPAEPSGVPRCPPGSVTAAGEGLGEVSLIVPNPPGASLGQWRHLVASGGNDTSG